MAEWLRRWTTDSMRTLHAGSIPGTGDLLLFFFYDDDGEASTKYKPRGSEATKNANASAKREARGAKRPSRQAGMSAANLGASLTYFSYQFNISLASSH